MQKNHPPVKNLSSCLSNVDRVCSKAFSICRCLVHVGGRGLLRLRQGVPRRTVGFPTKQRMARTRRLLEAIATPIRAAVITKSTRDVASSHPRKRRVILAAYPPTRKRAVTGRTAPPAAPPRRPEAQTGDGALATKRPRHPRRSRGRPRTVVEEQILWPAEVITLPKAIAVASLRNSCRPRCHRLTPRRQL